MWQNTPDQQQRYANGIDNSALQGNDVISDLKKTFVAIWRYKAWVIVTTVLCLCAGIAFIVMVDPLYRGTNQIFIDPRSKSLVENEIVPTGLGRSSIGGDLILLDSQIEIIRSDTVLRKVLEQEKADGLAPPPQGVGLVKALSNFVKGIAATDKKQLAGVDEEALLSLRKALWVTRLSNSYIVGINVRSNDPERSARLANMIAATYIEQQSTSRSSATRDTTITLNSRVETLRDQVRKAEAAVEAYRAETGLIGADGRLIDDDQLRDLNNRVVAAKAETSVARARAQSLKNASVSDVLAGSSSEALTSQVVSNLRLQLANLTRREAEALSQFGERHPSLAALRSERAGVNNLLSEELQRIVKAAENNLAVALTNEQFVKSQFDELTKASSANQKALVKLRELEREAASSRSVFESVLIRAKESDEQEELSNDSTRIITTASVPTIAFFPKKRLVIAASLFAGLSLGTLFAWLRALFTAPPSTSQTSDRRQMPRPAQDQAQIHDRKAAEASYPDQQDHIDEAAQATRHHQTPPPQPLRTSSPHVQPDTHVKNDDQWRERVRENAQTNYDYAPPQSGNQQRAEERPAPRSEVADNRVSQSKRLFERLKKRTSEQQQRPQHSSQSTPQPYSEPRREPRYYREPSYQDPMPPYSEPAPIYRETAPVYGSSINEGRPQPQHRQSDHAPAPHEQASHAQPARETANHSRPAYQAEPHDMRPHDEKPHSEPTADQRASSLSEAIHALLPRSRGFADHRDQQQSPIQFTPQPTYPEHLVESVNPMRDPVGHGGRVYGDDSDRGLSNLIAKVDGTRGYSQPHPHTSKHPDTSPYPRSRARDLLRKLGR